MSRTMQSSVSLRLAIALALGLALTACGSKEEAAAPATPTAAAAPSAAEQAAVQAAQQQAAALSALSGDELKKRGGLALREQRLYAPAGDNAMEYYLTLRKKSQKPDPSAESALIDLAPYAVIAAEQALGREDFLEAERLRSLIEQADPQAPALPRIADAIAKGKSNVANRATQDAARTEQLAKAAAEAKLKAEQAAAAAVAAGRTPPPVAAAPTPVVTAPPPPPVERERPTTVVAAPTPVAAAPKPAPPRAASGLVSISTPQPSYPPEALRAGTAGEVVVSFTVNTDGSVSNVELISARPRGVFERNVQSTVRRWRYQPIDSAENVTRTFTFSR